MSNSGGDQGEGGEHLSFKTLKVLFSNRVYIYTMLTLSAIFFSSVGLQFWTTTYLIKVLNIDPVTAQLTFGLCAITAPIPGGLTGGLVSDFYVSTLQTLPTF